jgi:hypothetical protein
MSWALPVFTLISKVGENSWLLFNNYYIMANPCPYGQVDIQCLIESNIVVYVEK